MACHSHRVLPLVGARTIESMDHSSTTFLTSSKRTEKSPCIYLEAKYIYRLFVHTPSEMNRAKNRYGIPCSEPCLYFLHLHWVPRDSILLTSVTRTGTVTRYFCGNFCGKPSTCACGPPLDALLEYAQDGRREFDIITMYSINIVDP